MNTPVTVATARSPIGRAGRGSLTSMRADDLATQVVSAELAQVPAVNPFLAASSAQEWPRWIESVDVIAALEPKPVVAGHKRPELSDDPKAIAETKAYLPAFIEGHEKFDSTRDLVGYVQDKFPDFANPSALLLSAALEMKAEKRLANG